MNNHELMKLYNANLSLDALKQAFANAAGELAHGVTITSYSESDAYADYRGIEINAESEELRNRALTYFTKLLSRRCDRMRNETKAHLHGTTYRLSEAKNNTQALLFTRYYIGD